MDIKHENYLTDILLTGLKAENKIIKDWCASEGIPNIPDEVKNAICKLYILKVLPKECALEIIENSRSKSILDQVSDNKDDITYIG